MPGGQRWLPDKHLLKGSVPHFYEFQRFLRPRRFTELRDILNYGGDVLFIRKKRNIINFALHR